MYKTYKCKEHGEITVERSLKDGELEQCPQCGKPIKRVFKSMTYLDCDGFVGKTYGCP